MSSPLTVTTPEIWPINARRILAAKKVSIAELKAMFEYVTFPWNNTYNTERTFFSLRIQQRPLFIVQPISILEIEKLLDYIKLKGLTVQVMNGRHSSLLTSSEVLVDMSAFTNKELIGEHLIAGAGNTQGALNEFLFTQNKREIYSHFGSFRHPRVSTEAFPGGSAGTVGSAGISTAGGVGTLCRTYSITVDSILSFKITLAPTATRQSRTVVATKDEHSNLFWALKGGIGSNFGIISEITYIIIEVPPVIEYFISWPWLKAAKIINLWKKQSLRRPVQFNEEIAAYYVPAMRETGIELSGVYVIPQGQSEHDAIKEIHKQVDPLGGQLTIKPQIPYSRLYKQLVQNRTYFSFSIIQTMFTDIIHSEQVVKLIDDAAAQKLNGPVSISFTLLGGAINTPTSSAAFYPRKKHFFIDLATRWDTMPAGQPIETWANEATRELLKTCDTYAYVGFPITFTNIPHTNLIYFGKHYPRLQKIKRHYDPLNIFTHSGLIKP